VATQLNWGASYLVADVYRRFVRRSAPDAHYVRVSRLATILLVAAAAWVSVRLNSIAGGWQVVLEVGAGTGAVYLLRWYWWRINAWSEITAMVASLVVSLALRWEGLWLQLVGRASPFAGSDAVVFAKTALTTAAITTVAWVVVTLATAAEEDRVLVSFYRKARPDARGWRRIAALAPDVPPQRDLGRNLAAWALGCGLVYCALFGTGKLLLREPVTGIALLAAAAVCGVGLARHVARTLDSAGTAGEGAVRA
jgi:hypothetical protein